MTNWSPEQLSNAKAIVREVKAEGLSNAAATIALCVAITESTLRNVDYGDRPPSMGGAMSSSRGLFQQIRAWGPLADRMDPAKATRMFLNGGADGQRGLKDIAGWNTLKPWVAAQKVQGSEFADGRNYLQNYPAAVSLMTTILGGPTQAPSAPTPPLGQKRPYPGFLLRQGATGAAVLELQRLLNIHGAGLPVTGNFLTMTLAAVRKFQASKGLQVDGVVGPLTWAAL
jgi:hypothetical protein